MIVSQIGVSLHLFSSSEDEDSLTTDEMVSINRFALFEGMRHADDRRSNEVLCMFVAIVGGEGT